MDGQLRSLWAVGATGATDDGSLLSRYALGQDATAEEAFRVLVERHGPMVFRVCLQLIGDRQDAEDATQAVFLVLARKAGSIRVEKNVAPWLHGVARRVAAKARDRTAARRQAEIKTAGIAASLRDRGGDEHPGTEDWELIHQEVNRLPEKYRTPVVLCYLQEHTYEQAASRIGCPVGTIRVRLSRARERLRGRLQRLGLGPERTVVVGWLMGDQSAVLVPTTTMAMESVLDGANWVEATVRAARALGLGRHALAGTVTASVLDLYQGVVQAMMMNRWITAAWLLAAGMAGAGAIGFAATGPGGQDKAAATKPQPPAAKAPTQKPTNDPPVVLDSPDTLRKVTERRVIAARERLDAQRAFYEEGRITLDRMIDASKQLMLAETTAGTTKDQRVAAAKAHWDRMADLVKRERSEMETGRGTVADVAEAVVAHENAVFEYLEIRQSRASTEIEALKQRVETLEKQLESLKKPPALPATERR
jgi:RNA polymerase sigma factor (sigma-70 family)